MESSEETLADKLEQTLNSKNKLKGIINRLSSEGIGSKKFSDYDTVLKNLPLLYNVRTIPGTVVAEFNKNNTPFNFNNNTEFKYYPVGGDTDLNNGNRVISKQNLNLDSSETEIKFDDFFNYDDTATSFALNYSEAFGTLKKFKVNSKALYLNIEPNTALSTPPWSVEDSPNLERLHGPYLHFYNNGEKIVFKNLPKLTYLSFSGSAYTLPKLSTLYADCPKLETVRVKLKPIQYTNLEEITNTLIIDQSLEEVHIIIDSADTTGKCYLQGLTKPTSDCVISKLTLESINTENSATELFLYTKYTSGLNTPDLSNVRSLEIVKDFDCCLILGNLQPTVIEQLPQMLENLKYNDGNIGDRYLQIHPIVEYNYSPEIIQAIKDVLEEKNWTYVENY